jgi:hypothetical protein
MPTDATSGEVYPAFMTSNAELAEARTFLSGWTLSRYVARFQAEAEKVSEDFLSEGGDGVTPMLTPGGGAFGWSRAGPPPPHTPPSTTKKRPKGILTIPTSATVGQVSCFFSEQPLLILFRAARRLRTQPPR